MGFISLKFIWIEKTGVVEYEIMEREFKVWNDLAFGYNLSWNFVLRIIVQQISMLSGPWILWLQNENNLVAS